MFVRAHPSIQRSVCEIRVASADRRGARALACLLADVGQRQGLLPLSIHPAGLRGLTHQQPRGEHLVVRFATRTGPSLRIAAVLDADLETAHDGGFTLVNSRKSVRSTRIRSVDADAIARRLGIPAYLPMVGAVARMAGWSDLEQVKSAVRLALTESAPHWLGPGLDAVEAGYHSLA